MLLGEQGADYIGFGIPAHVTDRDTAIARRHDLVQWWAEIFEVPVVAFDVETAAEAAELATAGADFIAVRAAGDIATADLASWLGEFAAALEKSEPVTLRKQAMDPRIAVVLAFVGLALGAGAVLVGTGTIALPSLPSAQSAAPDAPTRATQKDTATSDAARLKLPRSRPRPRRTPRIPRSIRVNI